MVLDRQVNRVLLGEYIEQVDVRNTALVYGEADVMGISTTKSFISTKADLSNVSLASYKIVDVNQFAYVADTSRRGDKIGLAFQDKKPCLISSIYTTFRVKDEKQLDPYYLMMFFKRPEFDRYARFHSWGSARETFGWEDMCNIEIPLPGIEVQREYVAVYKAMQRNLEVMNSKLDDLKLVCDGYIENLRKQYPSKRIGEYITEVDERNSIGLGSEKVRGLATSKELIETKADMTNVGVESYKLLRPNQIAFVSDTSRRGDKMSMGFNDSTEAYLLSSISTVFQTDESHLASKYLMLYLTRPEFDRYARFHSWGSARETFTWEDMCEVQIPIPPIDVQRSIVAIYDVYNKRKQYAERMRQQINEVCPVLVAMTSQCVMHNA
mgnify:CR=1 FL=1